MYYWTSFLADWTSSIQVRLPRYMKIVQTASSSTLSNHNYHIVQQGDLPEEYIEVFKRQSYRIENFAYHHRSRINELVSAYVYKLRSISSASRELLVRKTNDLYAEASEQQGTSDSKLIFESHTGETWLTD